MATIIIKKGKTVAFYEPRPRAMSDELERQIDKVVGIFNDYSDDLNKKTDAFIRENNAGKVKELLSSDDAFKTSLRPSLTVDAAHRLVADGVVISGVLKGPKGDKPVTKWQGTRLLVDGIGQDLKGEKGDKPVTKWQGTRLFVEGVGQDLKGEKGDKPVTRWEGTRLFVEGVGQDLKGEKGDPGKQGNPGPAGAMFRPRGVWDSYTTYYNNSSYRDVVCTNDNGQIRYWAVRNTSQVTGTKPAPNVSYWEEVQSFVGFVAAAGVVGKLTSEQIDVDNLKVGAVKKRFYRIRNSKPSNSPYYEKTWTEFCETIAAGYEVTGIPATGLSIYLPPAEKVQLGTRVHFNVPTNGVSSTEKFLYIGDENLLTPLGEKIELQNVQSVNPRNLFSLSSSWAPASLRPLNVNITTSPKPPLLDFVVALWNESGQCFTVDSEVGCFGSHVWVWLNAPDISLQDLVIRGNTKIDVLNTDMIAMRNQLNGKLSVSDLHKHTYAKKSRYIDSSSVTTTIYPSDSVICPAGPLIIRDSSDWAVGSAIEIINHNTSSQIRLTLYSSDAARVSAPLTKTSYSTYSYVYIPAKCIVRAVKVHNQGMWVFYKVGEFSW